MGSHALLQGIFLTQGANSLMSPALAGRFFTTSTTWEALKLLLSKAPKQHKGPNNHVGVVLPGPLVFMSPGI